MIPRDEWPETLQHFSDQHRDWLVAIREQHGEAPPSTLIAEAALDAVLADMGAEDTIRIVMKRDHGEEKIVHRVLRPWTVSVEQTPAHEHVGLTIVSHDGTRTELRFRTAVLPETVDGVI